ncbi:MAG: RNA polymerase sigma factor [Solirubrobacteraceae bacterium]
MSATAGFASAQRYEDFEVERDYVRLRGPLLGLLRRDGWRISDDEWDVVWNAVCLNVWRRQQADGIDFRGEPLNYLLASAKNELRRERRRARPDVVSLDSENAPEPSSPTRELDDELDMRDKLRLAHTIARHRLRPRELRVWGLRVVCGLTYEEGAERLGITPKRFEKELLSAHAKIADEIRAVAAGTWCESVKGVSLLRAYEAGILDPDGDALRELREHAATCPACRRAIKTVEGIVPMLLPPAPVLLALSASAPDGDGHAERLMQHLIEDGGELVTAAPADQHPVVHAPSIVERAFELARLTAGRHGGAVAETAPASSSAAELVGSASAGGAALGSGLVAKLLVAGGVAVCAIGGQEICADLLGSSPTPRASKPHIVALRPKFPHSVTPSVKAAQAQPRAGATAAQQIAHRARVATIHRAQRRALARSSQRRALARSSSSTTPSASPPAASAASAAHASSSDPTFSSTAPTTSRPTGGSGGDGSSGGGSSAGSDSSSDSTFQGLP